jgi:porin
MVRSKYYRAAACIVCLVTTGFSWAQEDLSHSTQQLPEEPRAVTNLDHAFTPPGKIHHPSSTPPKPSEGGAPSGPLSSLGTSLHKAGISPVLNFVQFNFFNPTMGLKPGYMTGDTIFTVGADFDLQRSLKVRGATIHFSEVFVPTTRNFSYSGEAGDSIVGQPPPYITKMPHLVQFTWEQKFFGTPEHPRLDIEGGKANAFNWFAVPNCNQMIRCQSVIQQRDMGINPPQIYANWLARVAYNVTPALTAQVGEWRHHSAFPSQNGYEWSKSAGDSNGYAFNLSYQTTYQTRSYPQRAELLFYDNTATQTQPYYGTTHPRTSGMYAGYRQVIWRPDGTESKTPFPRAVSVFANYNTTFDAKTEFGMQEDGKAGFIIESPFKKRLHDSYAIQATWNRVTNSEQALLRSLGGSGYTVGRNEFALGPDANFVIKRRVILGPFMVHTWNTNAAQMPFNNSSPSTNFGNPKDGWAGGVMLVVLVDRFLGL